MLRYKIADHTLASISSGVAAAAEEASRNLCSLRYFSICNETKINNVQFK